MTLIDTHCHLTYTGLLEQQAAVVERAKAACVGAMVTIGTHPPDHALVLQTLAAFDCVAGALGVHPHHAAAARRMCPSSSPQPSRRASTVAMPVPDTTPNCPRRLTARASFQSDTPTPIPP